MNKFRTTHHNHTTIMKCATVGRRGTIALALALVLASSAALDRSNHIQNQSDLDPSSTDVSASENLQTFRQTLEDGTARVSDNSCPVCHTDKHHVVGPFVQSVLSKYKRLIRNSSSFAGFRRALRRPLVRRQYNKRVSAETITPILHDTASHFAALADTARVLQDRMPDPARADTAIFLDVYAVLEQVATSSALLITEVSNILQSNDAVTAGIVATSVLSILGFFERVTAATTSTLTSYVAAFAGIPVRSAHGKLDTFSDLALDAVFSDVLAFLSARGDRSGLITAIGSVDASLSNLKGSLLQLYSKADTVSTSMSIRANATSDTLMLIEGAAQVVSLIDRMAFTVLSSVIRLVVAIPPVVGGIATGTAGLFQQRIETIVTLVNSTSSSNLEILNFESRDTAVSGDTVFLILCSLIFPQEDNDDGDDTYWQGFDFSGIGCALPLIILTSPIWLTLFALWVIIDGIFIGPNQRSNAAWLPIRCQMDALTCRNNALAASLPSL
jgi:hypothetical protein